MSKVAFVTTLLLFQAMDLERIAMRRKIYHYKARTFLSYVVYIWQLIESDPFLRISMLSQQFTLLPIEMAISDF